MTKAERKIYDRERRLANLERYNLNNKKTDSKIVGKESRLL